MKNAIKLTLSVAVITFFAFIAFASGNRDGDKIDPSLSKEEIKNAIQGKWRSSMHYNGTLINFRYEIINDKIKIWHIVNEMVYNNPDFQDFNNDPDEVVNYSIGDVNTDENGIRQILIASGESFGKLIIHVYNDGEGRFEQIYGNEQNSMFNDWKD